MAPENLLVNLQDQVVFKPAASFLIAPSGANCKFLSLFCLNVQVKVQGNCCGIEARSEIGRGGRETKIEGCGLFSRCRDHCTSPLSVASTAAGVASTSSAFRRKGSICASIPITSSSRKSVPRWKSIV